MNSTMANPKPLQMITCPYNKAHQIEHSRIQFHLEKCRKQYPRAAKATCVFNAKHVVNEAEMDFHVANCPDRFMFDNQKYVVDDDIQPRQLPPIPVVETEENWEDAHYTVLAPHRTGSVFLHRLRVQRDDNGVYRLNNREEQAQSYVPDFSNKTHIITKVKGATPAQRRQARMDGVRNYRPVQK